MPAKNLKEFIALAKANPGKLEYGTTGVGSSPHLSFELFKSMTKTEITFVPEIRQRLIDLGVDVEPQNSTEFTAFFRAETAKWIKTAREAVIATQ